MSGIAIPTSETERLRLRALRPGDLDDYAALNADPELWRHRGAGLEPWDRGRSWRHLAFLIGHWELAGAGAWAAEHRETGDFLGWVGFSCPEGWPGFELAGMMAKRFWGQGYAVEGARAALAYAFEVLEKDHVVSFIHPENRASIRVAEEIGESLEGTIHHLGQEMLRYGIRREAWLALPRPGLGAPVGEDAASS